MSRLLPEEVTLNKHGSEKIVFFNYVVDCLCTKLDQIAPIVLQSILYRYIVLLFLKAVKQYLCVTLQRLSC